MAKMYMIAKHTEVLRNPKNHSEGKMTNESFKIEKSLKNRDLEEASIILDVVNLKVVKNRFTERRYEDLYKYFVTHYERYINTWLKENTR